MSENDLTIPGGKLRLHVEVPLGAGLHVTPDDQQAHYLIHVMRAKPGDRISLFNGRDGEWSARIAEVTKRACSLECDRKIAEQTEVPDVWLCFAPIKKTPADFVVQKATELGVRSIIPLVTERVEIRAERYRGKAERWRKIVFEAVKQSGRSVIPAVEVPATFDDVIQREGPKILFDAGADRATQHPGNAATLFIGPEGGWSENELQLARDHGCAFERLGGRRVARGLAKPTDEVFDVASASA